MLALPGDLISALFKLAHRNNDLTCKLVYGVLSEFTRPGVQYSQPTMELIATYIQRKLPKITQSHLQTIFAIKLIFHLSNKKALASHPTAAMSLALELIQSSWKTQAKGHPAKTVSEILENSKLPKYLMFLSSLLAISNSSEHSHDQKKKLIDTLIQGLQSAEVERMPVFLHLL